RPAADRPKRAIPPTIGIAGLPAAPGPRARPRRDVRPGSFAEPSCQKIVFDLQLADLPVQNINLRLAARPLRRRAATLENTRRAVQQLLLPVVDLIRVNPELARQLGNRPVTLHRRQRHLRFERRVVLLPCLLHLLLPRHRRFLRGRAPPSPTVSFSGSSSFHHVAFSGTAGSRSILPVCRDVGNYSLGESHFLNLARHRAQIDQQPVHFRHPYKWIAADQAGKRPLRVEYPCLEGLLDDPRLGVEGALPDAECGAEICRCQVRRKRSVTEKIDPP